MDKKNLNESSHQINYKQRIQLVRDWMKKKDLNALFILSTDDYLSETIPLQESQRVYLSGFKGSVGDLLILEHKAFLFVDGRYYLQAEREVDSELIEVVQLSFNCTSLQGIQSILMTELKDRPTGAFRVALNQNHISYLGMKTLYDKRYSLEHSVEFVDTIYPLYLQKLEKKGNLEAVAHSISNSTFEAKFNELRASLKKRGLDFILITQLDELAYLFNLRFYGNPFNSTFKGFALIGVRTSFLFLEDSLYRDLTIRKEFERVVNKEMEIVSESDGIELLLKKISALYSCLDKEKSQVHLIGLDFAKVSYGRYKQLRYLESMHRVCRWKFCSVESPLFHMKKIKTKGEVNHFFDICHRSDRVFVKTIHWLNKEKKEGNAVSEKQFADRLTQEFFNIGARALSFEPIVAAGEHSAIIHYSYPSATKQIEDGDLLLIDAGAYFEGGYATDMTRVYLVGEPNDAWDKQRYMYSLVLKASLEAMRASFPKGTRGVHLDTLARHILWQHGYQFLHSVGHGVGIAVHEMPPSIGPYSMDLIEENMIFSIEPGLYIKGFGGVRIENLVLVCKHPKISDWLCLRPLNQCPLDERLIDKKYFNQADLKYLKTYGYISAK